MCEAGKGTFGKVLRCKDVRTGAVVAVKVVRKIRKYTTAARVEADILSDVARADPEGSSLCVRYFESFIFNGHMCLVFEALGMSLYEYVSANDFRSLPLFCVQSFADQLLSAVAFLHEMHLVHTDLKLENVLLRSTAPLVKTEKPTRTRQPMRVLAPQSTDIRREGEGDACASGKDRHSRAVAPQRRDRAVRLYLSC